MKKLWNRLADAFLDVMLERKVIDFVAAVVSTDVVKAMQVRVFEVARVEIARLELKPGDKIILKYPGRLSAQAFQHLHSSLKPSFPDHEILILEEGTDLMTAHDD